VAVVGEKEENEGVLAVTVRESNTKKDMKVDGLADEIKLLCKGKPFEKLNLSRQLSQRAIIYSL